MVNVWGGECLGGERLTIVETRKIVFNTEYYQCGKLGLLGFCLCKLQRYFDVFRLVCLKKNVKILSLAIARLTMSVASG